MLRNQNLQLHNTYTTLQVGSPPPTLACPYCLRHFHSKGGRTKHIQVKHHGDHANGPNPHSSYLILPPSPVPSESSSNSSSHSVQFERPPSPIIPSDSTPWSPSPSPSLGEADTADNFADIGIDAEYPQFNQDHIPPDLNTGDELNEDLPPRDNPMPVEQHTITYIYHPKLNGK